MRTTWRVTRVTESEAATVAELTRVEWFKRNPDFDVKLADESYEGDMPEQFIEALPGDPGAEFMELDDRMTLDISAEGDPDLHPTDDVFFVAQVAA